MNIDIITIAALGFFTGFGSTFGSELAKFLFHRVKNGVVKEGKGEPVRSK